MIRFLVPVKLYFVKLCYIPLLLVMHVMGSINIVWLKIGVN